MPKETKKVEQVKIRFTTKQLELLKEAAGDVPLVHWGRLLMLREAAARLGLSKSRLRGNVSDSVNSDDSPIVGDLVEGEPKRPAKNEAAA